MKITTELCWLDRRNFRHGWGPLFSAYLFREFGLTPNGATHRWNGSHTVAILQDLETGQIVLFSPELILFRDPISIYPCLKVETNDPNHYYCGAEREEDCKCGYLAGERYDREDDERRRREVEALDKKRVGGVRGIFKTMFGKER